MNYNSIWIFLLILQAYVTSLPIQDRYDSDFVENAQKSNITSPGEAKHVDTLDSEKEKVISVRITSSVAVGRGKEKLPYKLTHHRAPEAKRTYFEVASAGPLDAEANPELTSDLPQNLIGANIEYIKQLNAKKESKDHNVDSHYFQTHNQHISEYEPNPAETPTNVEEYDQDIKDVPTARKVPSISDDNLFYETKENRGYQLSNMKVPVEYEIGTKIGQNYNEANQTIRQPNHQKNKQDINHVHAYVSGNDNYQIDDSIAESSIKSVEFAKTTATMRPSTGYMHSLPNDQLKNEHSNSRLTTVSFNVVHDAPKPTSNNERRESYVTSSQVTNLQQFYSPKIYSQPSKIYSVPSKFYSEPAKVYSEPSKIYSEPAKVYSEPAKVYSEPAKFYSEPASLHLDHQGPQIPPTALPNYTSWQIQTPHITGGSTINTTPSTTITHPYQSSSTQMEHQPERNYEIEENVSVLTDGRSHGVQESSTEKCKQDNCKVGYVVEGRQFKKYRVEERTSDGFIVGEYGVVRNEDGALRGVRYTADSDASPRLIHDALMKFLQLK